MTVLARLDLTRRIPELAVRTGHAHRPDAFLGILRKYAAGAGRLVVRVRVHGHQGELLCHGTSLPDRRPCPDHRAGSARTTGPAQPGPQDRPSRCAPADSRDAPASAEPGRPATPTWWIPGSTTFQGGLSPDPSPWPRGWRWI